MASARLEKTGLNTNMTNQTSWTVIVQEDPDDPESLILPFPDDLLEQTGWKIGDTLVWVVEDDRVTISKK